MTILCYVDEGGTTWSDPNTNLFFLASFAINVQQWSQMDWEFSALKKELFSGREPEDGELKERDIWQGQGSFKISREFRLQALKKVSKNYESVTLPYIRCSSQQKKIARNQRRC